MKNEAGLRRTERYERFASCERSECFTGTAGFRFTFADGKRFITDYVAIAREIAAATGGFYFTFCGAENFTTAERLFYILIFFKLVNLSGIYYDYIGETGFESTQRW